jgi:carbon starvation protein
MPVMLGVLAVLAVAYRFYSAFLAARVAALDDARATPAHTLNDGQNFHPTNRWVLFGHHFAAISGAGPLIGPVLAIQFGYMPGLIWLVVGVCLAGAVQDMMVLAASVRRGGRSLAGIARDEVGPAAGTATAVAILYIIVIALAGLGIVVVKALGGERVAMKAGTTLVVPEGQRMHQAVDESGHAFYDVPPGTNYVYGETPDESMTFHEGFRLSIPRGSIIEADPRGVMSLGLPEKAERLVPGSSWGTFTIACTVPIALAVGWYMYRFRKGKVVEASILGAVAVLGATVAGAFLPAWGIAKYFELTRNQTIFAMAAYGFVASILPVWLLLCPRDYLSSFLKIGTIALLVVGVIVANPKFEAPAINPVFASGGGPYFSGPIFPYVFICIMCGAISGFHALVSSGTRRR